jgi:hypothetical protein
MVCILAATQALRQGHTSIKRTLASSEDTLRHRMVHSVLPEGRAHIF